MPAEQASAWLAQMRAEEAQHEAEGPLQVWPCNADAWRVWMRLQTQWQITPAGELMALPHTALESALRMMRLWRRSEELYEQIADMERAALAPHLEE